MGLGFTEVGGSWYFWEKVLFATLREKVLSRRFGKKTSFQTESTLLNTQIITGIFCSIDYTTYHIRVLNTCITKHAYFFESTLPLEACRASFLLAFYNWHRWKLKLCTLKVVLNWAFVKRQILRFDHELSHLFRSSVHDHYTSLVFNRTASRLRRLAYG